MCEAVENYAKEYAKEYVKEYAKEYAKEYTIKNNANIIKNIMESTKCTLQEVLDNAKIFGEDRELIIEEISEGL